MIQICFPVFLWHFQKLVDMAASIIPYPCTASGQLQKMERIKIMDKLLADAMYSLPDEKQRTLLLYYFFEMTDAGSTGM